VSEQATFVGPVLIEAGARVTAGAVVVGPASVGRDVVVGAGALVSRSAVWRRCVIGEQSIADRCILADETVIAPQTQAFRSVVFNQSRSSLLERAVTKAGIRAPVPADMFKNLGRLANGTTLSRFPAAQ
jgi:NDP-sugar pyrophosphorylase family protein